MPVQWLLANCNSIQITFSMFIIRSSRERESYSRCHLQRCPWWGRQTASTLLAQPTSDVEKDVPADKHSFFFSVRPKVSQLERHEKLEIETALYIGCHLHVVFVQGGFKAVWAVPISKKRFFHWCLSSLSSSLTEVGARHLKKSSEMPVAPRISQWLGLPWSALVCHSLSWLLLAWLLSAVGASP